MNYPQSTTKRELRETIRWKGKDRPLIVEISNGNLVVRVKGVQAPHLPLSIAGCYEKALARHEGVEPIAPRRRR